MLGLEHASFPLAGPSSTALGPSVLRPTTQRPERQSLEAASWPSRLYSWVEHQDPWGFALESLLAFVPAGPLLCPGRSSPRRPKDPLALLARRGVCGWHLHPNGFPCVPPPGLAGTCLLFPSRREQPVARQGLVGLMALPPRHKTRAWELPPGKASSTRCLNTRPKGGCSATSLSPWSRPDLPGA